MSGIAAQRAPVAGYPKPSRGDAPCIQLHCPHSCTHYQHKAEVMPQGRIALPASPPCTHDIPPGLHGIAHQPTHSRMASCPYPPSSLARMAWPASLPWLPYRHMVSSSCPLGCLAWSTSDPWRNAITGLSPGWHGPPMASLASPPGSHVVLLPPDMLVWHHQPGPQRCMASSS